MLRSKKFHKHWQKGQRQSPGGILEMNARPEVRNVLLKKCMRKWLTIARYYPNRNPAQARRNFIRLVQRHPTLARELGFSVLTAYE